MQDLDHLKARLETLPFPPFPPAPPKKWKRRSLRFAILTAFFIVSVLLGWSFAKIDRFEQKYKKTKGILKYLQSEISIARSHVNTFLPPRLLHLPFAENAGIVLGTKSVNIRNVIAPYNPSILPAKNGGYDLFFRYDLLSPTACFAPFYHSSIGAVHFNHRFIQEETEFKRLSLHSKYAEDPRVCLIEDQLYLFYNILHPDDPRCRTMCVANLNPDTFTTNYVTALDLNTQWMEKNWCPFEYKDPDGKAHLYIEYQLSPRKLFSLPDPQFNDLRTVQLPHNVVYSSIPWTPKWGLIRGGTPAQKIGDEYLSFFHSSFLEDNGMHWYVMGAYTFSAKPPFAITRMSPNPILFRGIYDTPIIHTGDVQKRVIFPSGFVIDKSGERELVHLACGENDCAIKIVTMDKEKLLASMIPFVNSSSD